MPLRAAFACVAAAVGLLAVTPGCKDCTDEYVTPSYVIHVRDASTGSAICDATVYVNNLQVQPNPNVGYCNYGTPIPTDSGLPRVTIVAEYPGYETTQKDVSTDYPSDDCGHAEPIEVTLELQKQ